MFQLLQNGTHKIKTKNWVHDETKKEPIWNNRELSHVTNKKTESSWWGITEAWKRLWNNDDDEESPLERLERLMPLAQEKCSTQASKEVKHILCDKPNLESVINSFTKIKEYLAQSTQAWGELQNYKLTTKKMYESLNDIFGNSTSATREIAFESATEVLKKYPALPNPVKIQMAQDVAHAFPKKLYGLDLYLWYTRKLVDVLLTACVDGCVYLWQHPGLLILALCTLHATKIFFKAARTFLNSRKSVSNNVPIVVIDPNLAPEKARKYRIAVICRELCLKKLLREPEGAVKDSWRVQDSKQPLPSLSNHTYYTATVKDYEVLFKINNLTGSAHYSTTDPFIWAYFVFSLMWISVLWIIIIMSILQFTWSAFLWYTALMVGGFISVYCMMPAAWVYAWEPVTAVEDVLVPEAFKNETLTVTNKSTTNAKNN